MAISSPQNDGSLWHRPAPLPVLGADEVHVWRIPLDLRPEPLARLRPLLDKHEQRRADRFYLERHRAHMIAARGRLRLLLSRYLGTPPDQVRFRYESHGKPVLEGQGDSADFHFNLSHSHGLALCALARGRQVGVDVEWIRPAFATEPFAQRYFSPVEVKALRRLPDALKPQGFFNCWTRKEAYIKATGQGLSLALDSFDVTLEPAQPAALLAVRHQPAEVQRWSMCELQPGPGYAGALVVEGQSWQLKCWDWIDALDSE